ncbi:MAG: type II secretion system F family protein [Chloroflexi bacterium]|uniref:Type II secretion system F family protein n=1 Tax=Candidatus Chlorohelix allophototropha TaxID=3003348 RepID=A0A8T7M4V3_9CHLR|nr:type II secretion system F family protein [Chloroflexota bacterium]WJW70272.1 type II secretion system F family protein [Chloroflexota bacterium L227-S17]
MTAVALAFVAALAAYLIFDALTRPPKRPPEEWELELDRYTRQKKGKRKSLAERLGLPPRQVQAALALGLPGGTGAMFIAWLVWHWPVLVLFAGILGFIAPLWVALSRRESERLAFQKDLAIAIDSLRSQLQSGGGGILSGLQHLGEKGPKRLREEFRQISEEVGLPGYGLEIALRRAQERLQDSQFDVAALSLIAADRGGGPVGDVLSLLSTTIRDHVRVRRQVRAEQVRSIWSARVIAISPIVILTFLKLIGGGYTDPYETAGGQLVLLMGVLLMLGGYLSMRRLGRIPAERRSFK